MMLMLPVLVFIDSDKSTVNLVSKDQVLSEVEGFLLVCRE